MANRVDRRGFLKLGATAGLTSVAGGVLATPDNEGNNPTTPNEPRVARYVQLGNTDMKISDVSFGSSRLSMQIWLLP